MAHYTQDLVGHDAIVCGNDVAVRVPLFQGDGTTPLDLTGVTDILYIVKRRLGEVGPPLINLSLSDAVPQIDIIGDPDEGIIDITLKAEDTLPAVGRRLVGYHEHELTVFDAEEKVSAVFQGTLEIRATARAGSVASS